MLQGLYWSEALSTANIMTLISKCVLGYVSFYCYVSASVFFFFFNFHESTYKRTHDLSENSGSYRARPGVS